MRTSAAVRAVFIANLIAQMGIVVTGAIGVLMTLFGIASAVVGKSRDRKSVV